MPLVISLTAKAISFATLGRGTELVPLATIILKITTNDLLISESIIKFEIKDLMSTCDRLSEKMQDCLIALADEAKFWQEVITEFMEWDEES